MKLVDMTVKDYLDLLKSDAPAPGGGSVSALAGAQGAGPDMSGMNNAGAAPEDDIIDGDFREV